MTKDAWRWGIGAWALLRVITTLSALASSAWLEVVPTPDVPAYTPPSLHGAAESLAGVWLRADALWYLRIAEHGYGPEVGSYAFYPMFPLLVRAAAPLFRGNELYAGLAVANAACVLGLVFIFAIAESLLDRRAAKAAVLGLALFPTAFFLTAPYGEAVFLAAGAGAVLAAIKGRAAPAALAGAAAALARPFGVLLVLPLAAIGFRRGRRSLAAGLGPVAGAGAWYAWTAAALGDPLAAAGVQSYWQRRIAFPPATLLEGAAAWWRWRGTPLGPYFLADLAAALFALGLVAAGVASLRRAGARPAIAWGLAIYCLLALAMPLASRFPPRPLLSLPRAVLGLFPAFLGYAWVPARLRIPAAALSAALLALATAVYVAGRPLF